jgi:2-polyprenyl-6-methoxyphenol hydroxylase-like FAD-dependent oxidoreductase
MSVNPEMSVVIAGAGPVGLGPACELGLRGIDCPLVEKRDGSVTVPKQSMVSARNMEFRRRWGPLAQAVRASRVPLREITIADPEIAALYERKLVLVRPDGRVAWRGDALKADPAGIVERMRGAAAPERARGRSSALAIEEAR